MDLWKQPRWGQPPWKIDFHPDPQPLPDEIDFAVIGGGFTGCAAAAWLRHIDPKRTVAVFEAAQIGAGSSGRTGGLALPETASGDMPGLGDVLKGLSRILCELHVDADLRLPGVWEIGREHTIAGSPISWQDSGTLGVTRETDGGTVDPGKMVSGLARAASEAGAMIFENAPVDRLSAKKGAELRVRNKTVRAGCVLVATNAESLELSGVAQRAESKFTLAVMTEPLKHAQLEALGLASGKPFYTLDLPYLWGRLASGNCLLLGGGLVHVSDWRELMAIDIEKGETAEMFRDLDRRVHGLHPVLRDVKITHHWGGPILIADHWQPVFMRHPEHHDAIVLGAYSGHGVALSVYLGAWAAEAMLGRRDLPQWNIAEHAAD